MNLSASDIIELLKVEYSQHVCIEELRLGTGFTNKGRVILPDKPFSDPDCERVIDLFTFAPLRSQGYSRTAFEIKISTSDFYRELADPTKCRAAIRFANKYYFVAPEEVIPHKKIPPECGLIVVNEYKKLIRIIEAPWHDNAPTWGFLASVLRRLTK